MCTDADTCRGCYTKKHYILVDNACNCDAPNHFVDDGTDCVCDKGYYLDADTCQACSLGCLTCVSSTECLTCK